MLFLAECIRIFTTWQAIPFKRKFYYIMKWYRSRTQLAITIIYNSTWSYLIQWIIVLIVMWQSDLVNTNESILPVYNKPYQTNKRTVHKERGDWSFAELWIAWHSCKYTLCESVQDTYITVVGRGQRHFFLSYFYGGNYTCFHVQVDIKKGWDSTSFWRLNIDWHTCLLCYTWVTCLKTLKPIDFIGLE